MELDPAHFADRLVSGMSDAVVYADAEGVIRSVELVPRPGHAFLGLGRQRNPNVRAVRRDRAR